MVNRDKFKAQRVSEKTFILVDTPAKQTALNRHPDGGTLYPTGRLVLNANGSDLWQLVVRLSQGIDPDHYLAKGGGNEQRQLIGVYAMPPGTPGGTGVRLTPREGSSGYFDVVIHLRNVFERFPDLRPTGKRKVAVGGDWDSAGRPYLEIDLQSQLGTKTTPRTPSSDSKADEKEKGKEKGKATGTSRKQPEPKEPPPADPDLEAEDELDAEAEE